MNNKNIDRKENSKSEQAVSCPVERMVMKGIATVPMDGTPVLLKFKKDN